MREQAKVQIEEYETYAQNGRCLPIYYFKPNTQYTITIGGYVTSNGLMIIFNHTDGNWTYGKFECLEEEKKIVKSAVNKTVKSITIQYGTQPNTAYISHMQLEEGSTATEYEPYQIMTSSTEVTKASNHILTAIWEPTSN